MTYAFRPAKRSEAKPLIGLYAESGCGKTWSALMLARGFVGPTGRIGMIETEAGRGEAYADLLPGGYIVCPIRDSFSPTIYGDAISAAEKAELDALIIDSASHEWEGAGGVLSMAAQNQHEGKKGPLVWQMPKLDHQRHFMLRLLSTPIPLVIVCMRAKYPMEEIIKDGKKEWARSEYLHPKQSEDILFELFVHGWIDRDHQFHGTKYSRDDLRGVIREGERISIKTGEALAEWARGGATAVSAPPGLDPRRALLTEIQQTIVRYLPGTSERDREAKGKLVRRVFGGDWKAVEALALEKLQAAVATGDPASVSLLEKAAADAAAALTT